MSLIKKQLGLTRLLANLYRNSILFNDHVILMEVVDDSNVPRISAGGLSGKISVNDFANIFPTTMDENLNNYLFNLA